MPAPRQEMPKKTIEIIHGDDGVVTAKIEPPIAADALRIVPKSYSGLPKLNRDKRVESVTIHAATRPGREEAAADALVRTIQSFDEDYADLRFQDTERIMRVGRAANNPDAVVLLLQPPAKESQLQQMIEAGLPEPQRVISDEELCIEAAVVNARELPSDLTEIHDRMSVIAQAGHYTLRLQTAQKV